MASTVFSSVLLLLSAASLTMASVVSEDYPLHCLRAYTLRENHLNFTLPPECMRLPTRQRCVCPDPETVKSAGKDVIIRSMSIRVRGRPPYTAVTVEAVVFNPTSNVQTADFETEVPKEAFISSFVIVVDGQRYTGVVKEKEVAAKEFKEAVTTGRTAGTVVQKSETTFGTNISVSAFCQVKFKLRYEYVLTRERGKFCIPLNVRPPLPVITRRVYVDLHSAENMDCLEAENYKDAKFVKSGQRVTSSYKLKPYELDNFIIKYNLNQSDLAEQPGNSYYDENGFVFVQYTLPQSDCFDKEFKPTCPSKVNVDRRRRHTSNLMKELISQDPEKMHSDEELKSLIDQNYLRSVERDRRQTLSPLAGSGYIPTETTEPQPECNTTIDIPVPTGDSIKKCVAFVVDVSGSMFGSKMEQAKESLILLLRKLRPYDCVTIIKFHGSVETIWELSVVSDCLEVIISRVEGLRAGGATNIDGALRKGIDELVKFQSSKHDCIFQLVLLTDGEPTAGETNPRLIEANYRRYTEQVRQTYGKDTYTYTLAYGEYADFTLLQNLAIENNGFARRIYLNEDVPSQLVEFYREIICPLLCGVKLNYNNASLSNLTQNNFGECFFDGNQIVFGGQIIGRPHVGKVSKISLSGKGVAGDVTLSNIRTQRIHGSSTFVERAYAYLKIRSLFSKRDEVKGEEERKALEDDILKMALKYQLVTSLTSIIVVKPCDEEVNRTTSKPTTGTPSITTPSITTPSVTTPSVTTLPVTTRPPGSTRPTISTGRIYSPVTIIDLDPHVIAETISGHRLCYTVDGKDGEVFNLLTDKNFIINGEVVSYRYKGKRKTFFGSVAIRFLHNCDFEDETKLLISALHGAAVLGSDIHIKWDTTIGYETDEVTVTPNGNDTIIVRFPKHNVELIFTQRYRGGYFLGFAFSDSAGYTPLAHGLIGQLLKAPSELFHESGETMIKIRGNVHRVKDWQRLNLLTQQYVSCYSAEKKGTAILEGNTTDYQVDRLFTTDTKFGSYTCLN